MADGEGGPKTGRGGPASWFKELDRLLRGELTGVSALRSGGIEISARRLSVCVILLAMFFGACMGTFTLFRVKALEGYDLRLMPAMNDAGSLPREGRSLIIVNDVNKTLHFRIFASGGRIILDTDEKGLTGKGQQIEELKRQLEGLGPPHQLAGSEKDRLLTAMTSILGYARPNPMQVMASMIKVPLLFYLTLLVTMPSLYVFNALVGSQLTLSTVIRLLVASMAVMVTVLASLGTIVAFFSFSTTSYPFMLLFNVAIFAVSGSLGLTFLLQTLQRLSVADVRRPSAPVPQSRASDDPSAPDELARTSELVPPEVTIGPLDPLGNRVLSGHVKTVFESG